MTLFRFNGGLHLDAHKRESTQSPVLRANIPPVLIIPLGQHIGEMAEPLVKPGDTVFKGQMIAKAKGYVSAPVHASSSGTVLAIEPRSIAHPSGLQAPCIVIETDGKDTWDPRLVPVQDYASLDAITLRNHIRDAGVVGLGGAVFPTFIKLNPGPTRIIHTLLINGAECEPYITCDDLLMRERAEQIISGMRVVNSMLKASRLVIGVEDNKPEAIAALRKAASQHADLGVEVVVVPTIYPTGGAKQLIQVITGKEVPAGKLSMDIGVVCLNVGTVTAIHDAIIEGHPLISRYVTITGDGIAKPNVVDARIGTPIAELIKQCGGYQGHVDQLIMGGPMMGTSLFSDEVPVVKAMNCVLAKGEATEPVHDAMPCIRCGDCASACPVNLLPQQMYWHAKAKQFETIQDFALFDCIECGVCSYVCPSKIPLVQYFRYAKSEIAAIEREKQKSDIARQRHESRKERIERENAEREAARRKKKAALSDEPSAHAGTATPGAIGNNEIAAAVARAKAKKTDETAAAEVADSSSTT